MNDTSSIPIVTDLKKLQPGQAIKMMYTAALGQYGAFSLTVPDDAAELSLENDPGNTAILSQPNGYFYFVCVGYSNDGRLKLVADRVIQTNISWETLNTAGLCTFPGAALHLDNKKFYDCLVRLPATSSIASLVDPESNEWDAIFSEELFSEEDFWNDSLISSWTMNTPTSNMSNRVIRKQDDEAAVANSASSTANTSIGFRPVVLIPDITAMEQGDAAPICSLEKNTVAAAARPGQAVSCRYTVTSNNTVGVFSKLGISEKLDIVDTPPSTLDGTFYFVCVGYDPSGALKFVADRVIQTGISWETLNAAGYCTFPGADASALTGVEGSTLRLMTSDIVQNKQSKNSSEWDAIIYSSTVGSTDISSNHVNEWNYKKTKSWMMNTPAFTDDLGNPADMATRIVRGQEDNTYQAIIKRAVASNFCSSQIGFRPVLTIPINQQPLIFTKEIVTPNHTAQHDVILHHEFSFINEDATLETTIFEYLLNTEPLFEQAFIPTKMQIEKVVPFNKLKAGANDIRIIVTCAGKQKVLAYTVTKEVSGDTARTRDYPKYVGGYNFGRLIPENKLTGDGVTIDYETPKRITMPKNLTAIHILDV